MGQGFSNGVRGGVLISYFMGISTGHASETTSLAACMAAAHHDSGLWDVSRN
jgi:hypothetical protein